MHCRAAVHCRAEGAKEHWTKPLRGALRGVEHSSPVAKDAVGLLLVVH